MNEQDDIFAPVEDEGWNTDDKCPWCKGELNDVAERSGKTFECNHCGKPVVCEEWTQFILKRPNP